MSKSTLLALLVPALLTSGLVAAEGNPGAVPSQDYLVDKVIPAYGVIHQRPYYAESRITGLYNTIRRELAVVEAGVLAGTSTSALPADKASAPVAPTDQSIQGMLAQLNAADKDILYRTYLEQGQIDESFANLARAAELLALRGGASSATLNQVRDAAAAAAPKRAPTIEKPSDPAAVPAPVKEAEKPVAAPAPEKPAAAPEPEKPAEAPPAAEKPAEAAAPAPEKPADAAAPAPEKAVDPAAPAEPEKPADPAAAPAAPEKPTDAAAPADPAAPAPADPAAPAAEKAVDPAAPAAPEAPPQPAQ